MTIFLASVVLPVLVMFLLAWMRTLVHPTRSVPANVLDVGYDLCILAVGVTGGVFASERLIRVLDEARAVLYGFVVAVVNLMLAVGILKLEQLREPDRVTATAAFVMGAVALSLPSALALATP